MVLFSILPFLLALVGYVHGYITLHQKFFDKKALYSQDFLSAGLDFSLCTYLLKNVRAVKKFENHASATHQIKLNGNRAYGRGKENGVYNCEDM